MENMTVGKLIGLLEKVEDKNKQVYLYDERLDNYFTLKDIPDTVEDSSSNVDLNFHSEEDSQDSERWLATPELDFTYENIYNVLKGLDSGITRDVVERVYNTLAVDTEAISQEIIADYYRDILDN